MPHDHTYRFFLLFAAGLGLLLVAGVNLGLRRRSGRMRALTTALVLAGVLVGFALWRQDFGAVSRLAVVLVGAILGCTALSSPWLIQCCCRIAQGLARPGTCWPVVGAVGLLTLIAAVGLHEIADAESIQDDHHELEWQAYRPTLADARIAAFTDRGTPIALKAAAAARSGTDAQGQEQWFLDRTPHRDQLIRRGPAHDHANCHGWVFTDGRYWLSGETVERILIENGYQPHVSPRRGDLVIYREHGVVCHTAVVRYVSRGMPVLVEGKWGPFGTYLHPVEATSYGSDYTFYRSSRGGHLLAGLQDESDERVTE